nr:MAG: LytTr DNA-binding domain [Bacteriophage sp.]
MNRKHTMSLINSALTNLKHDEAKKFYTQILPNHLENTRKSFKGTTEELNGLLEEMEEDLVFEFWENLDKKIEQEKEELKNEYRSQIKNVNLQEEGNQPLATEIICDQKREIEKLKAELRREKARHEKTEQIEYRKDFTEIFDKIKDEQLLRCLYIIASDILEESLKKKETLTVKFRRQINRLKYDEIEYVESQARVCHIFATNNRCFVTTCKLNDLEEKLSDKRFLRCHQSYLVNMDHIQSAGDNFVMDSGDIVQIRQNGAKEIKEKYEEYIS